VDPGSLSGRWRFDIKDVSLIDVEEDILETNEDREKKRGLFRERSLPELLSEQVRAYPGNIAVVQDNKELTYRELADNSAELAVYLRHLGVGRDDCVGLFVEPSLELMIGAWGILLSGGAYLPLSPEYPEDRLRYMIEDAGVKVVVSQAKLEAEVTTLAPRGTTIVTVEEAVEFARKVASAPDVEVRPESLAYIIYTSGSTGKPKGVMIEHRSVVNQLDWLKNTYRLGAETVILQKTPMSFDAAQWEILAPATGSKVVMGAPGVYRDPARLLETIERHGVTTLQCVPTLLEALLDTDELHLRGSLTQIFSGGETLTKTLALRCLEALPDGELVNLYGPTECTINSSAFTVDRESVAAGPGVVSIGAPVDGMRFHILDGSRSPVAPGEIGELYIGGIQLARGYLHRPDLTEDRFIADPFGPEHRGGKLFRSGDLAYWNADGTVQFAGRTDNQIKLRGFRIELDEIKLGIESHAWVKNAAVVVKNQPGTGFQHLIAFVELNSKEAALMDQGNHGAHHQSKESKLQVKAQLSNLGCRDGGELDGKAVITLPDEPADQRRQAFERKTYRFFDGGDTGKADLLRMLARRAAGGTPRGLDELTLAGFGEILRYFGQHLSDERLLPKYGYASPGSLYATQMYFELNGVCGLAPGYYYYHPVRHEIVLITEKPGSADPRIKIHFLGKKRAIEPVYQTNIQEVLEIETGHMVGLFEEILPARGLGVVGLGYFPAEKAFLECAEEDCYLGTFAVVPHTRARMEDPVEIYVQAHPDRIADLPAGQYHYRGGELERISDELVAKKQVIAINQQVYDRASVGITVMSRNTADWLRYIDLGRTLQRLSMNEENLGFMSAGYSSRSGADLPSARQMRAILEAGGRESGPSYFFVGGRVTDGQRRSEGMNEDVVHMKGPAEMIRDDLSTFLPDYMIPNRVTVLDSLPSTVNGKVDTLALEALAEAKMLTSERPFVAPRTPTEERIAAIWAKKMKRDDVSVHDNFFESGGNSLIAVGMITEINRALGAALALQVLFESPTVEQLALKVDGEGGSRSSRLVPLQAKGTGDPVYCWPGLGGYPMNLRSLAEKAGTDRPFYGVQTLGVNEGEVPFATIKEMAAEDVMAIKRRQPVGPYTLWGYSFGARIAFEAAYQLEQAGERVERLLLIAPGSPRVRVGGALVTGAEPTFANKAYVTILFSVFAGTITGEALEECLAVAEDEESFTSFICGRFPELDPAMVKRVAGIVALTYQFSYTFRELAERRITAPITIFKARGDDYSFIDASAGYSALAPEVVALDADHYGLLREPGVGELVEKIGGHVRKGITVPHVNIKHFPASLSEEKQAELVANVTRAIKNAFACDEGAISIALEPVGKDSWNERVYVPEIVDRKDLLCKVPNY